MKDLLEKVAELKETGSNKVFRTGFHTFAGEYNLDTRKAEGKDSTALKDLVSQLNELTPKQITELISEVSKLKKQQDKGPSTGISQVQEPKKHVEKAGQDVA